MAKKQLSIWVEEDLVEFARSMAMEYGLVTNVRTIGDEPTGSISKLFTQLIQGEIEKRTSEKIAFAEMTEDGGENVEND